MVIALKRTGSASGKDVTLSKSVFPETLQRGSRLEMEATPPQDASIVVVIWRKIL